MYPFIRIFWQYWRAGKLPPLELTQTHVSHHYCLPWDIDLWMELNNGRTLTLYDLGRIPLVRRLGMIDALKATGWGVTVAGASVRYRRRVRMFERIEMRSRTISWDERFFYYEQSMWKANGDCANHILYRSAVTSKDGIVPPAKLLARGGADPTPPDMPDWVKAWVEADATRPWPPMPEPT